MYDMAHSLIYSALIIAIASSEIKQKESGESASEDRHIKYQSLIRSSDLRVFLITGSGTQSNRTGDLFIIGFHSAHFMKRHNSSLKQKPFYIMPTKGRILERKKSKLQMSKKVEREEMYRVTLLTFVVCIKVCRGIEPSWISVLSDHMKG